VKQPEHRLRRPITLCVDEPRPGWRAHPCSTLGRQSQSRAPSRVESHCLLILVFGEASDLSILDLKNGCRTPLGLATCRFNLLVRFAIVAALRGVPQGYMAAFGSSLVKSDDAQVRDGGHYWSMGLGVVLGRGATTGGSRCPEPCIVMAKTTNGHGALVLGGRVCNGHVFLADIEVGLLSSAICLSRCSSPNGPPPLPYALETQQLAVQGSS
jgi:hypothetical protein